MNASMPYAWVLLWTLAPASVLAQSSASVPGFEVERSQSVQTAPPGSVGRKTVNREHRVGNGEDTLGDETTFELTLGGFARGCPTSDGKVEGDFEYAITYDSVAAGSDGVIRREHAAHRFAVRLTGEVGDDARLKHVDMEGEFTSERSGTDVAPTSRRIPVPRRRFVPGPQGEPDIPAMSAAAELTEDLGAASAVLWAGLLYRDAEAAWTALNACVEFRFDPPTDTQLLQPNQSRDVRVSLHSKENGERVPWATGELTGSVGAIEGIGSVAPREVQAADGAPITLTYTASAQPRRGHGIDVSATSRAGVGNGLWHILDGFEGTFSQTRTMTVGGADVPAGSPGAGAAAQAGLQVSLNYEITGKLVWGIDTSRTRTPQFAEKNTATYVPVDGELTVAVHSNGRSISGACVHEGSKTFAIRELPPAALQYLQLDVAEDGRYKLMLGMISSFLQFELEGVCNARSTRRIRNVANINDAAIGLGIQEGRITDSTVRGQTATPIVDGLDRYEGRWEFKKPGAP